MNLEFLKTVEFFYSLGYVTLCSCLITMFLLDIIKLILKQAKVLNKETNPIRKDSLLSLIGRIVALVVYASIYIVDIYFIKHSALVVDTSLFASLLSGSALTLCISKGIYTGLRQMAKKKSVFEKLEVAEVTINKLQEEIKELNLGTNNEEVKEKHFVLGKKGN